MDDRLFPRYHCAPVPTATVDDDRIRCLRCLAALVLAGDRKHCKGTAPVCDCECKKEVRRG